MSQGPGYFKQTQEEIAYKLELLNSILPLLSPTLLAPPSPTDIKDAKPLPAQKRKHQGDNKPLKDAIDIKPEAEVTKRVRLAELPSKPTTVTIKVEENLKSSPVTSRPPTVSVSSNSRSASENIAPSQPPPPVQVRQEGFTKERLRKLATAYREKGREVKHQGDATRRTGGPDSNRLATIQQADAIMIYVFSYWCDDQAAKQTLVINWKAIFALLSFVKSTAEKAGMGIVVGLCSRIEAYTLHRIFLHDQKTAIYRASQIILPPSPSLHPANIHESSRSPQSQGSPAAGHPAYSPPHHHSTLPNPNPAHPNPQLSSDLLKSFSKAGNELFRFNRLWEEAAVALSPAILVREAPRTWRLCIEGNVGVEPADWGIPAKPWRFAWPVDLQRSHGLVQEIGFARAVLEEVAEREGLEFAPAVVHE